MSRFSSHWHSGAEVDILWKAGLFGGSIICCISIFIFIRIVQFQYCISRANRHDQFEPKDKTYSTLSAMFAMLSVNVYYALYLIASGWPYSYILLALNVIF